MFTFRGLIPFLISVTIRGLIQSGGGATLGNGLVDVTNLDFRFALFTSVFVYWIFLNISPLPLQTYDCPSTKSSKFVI